MNERLHSLDLLRVEYRAEGQSGAPETIIQFRLSTTRRQREVEQRAQSKDKEEHGEQMRDFALLIVVPAEICCFRRILLAIVYWNQDVVDEFLALDRSTPPREMFEVSLTQCPRTRLRGELRLQLLQQSVGPIFNESQRERDRNVSQFWFERGSVLYLGI